MRSVTARLKRRAASGRARAVEPAFAPVWLLELELSAPDEPFVAPDDHAVYGSARVLVRLHGSPVGVVEVGLHGRELSSELVVAQAQRELGAAIAAHIADDGPDPEEPHCLAERRAFASRAPFASVVIGTRERPESLATTLEMLLDLDYPAFEIVVVDNAPTTERTRELVERRAASAPSLRYVREPLPGLAAAHNRGLALARGEIVAFTDDDVAVDRRWLLELARSFELAPDVACVTGLIMPAELESPAQLWLEEWVGVNKGYRERLFDLRSNRPAGVLFPYTAGVFGSGANMAFRTDTLKRIGGFDPAIGTGTRARGGDDLAAFFSVVAAGHTLVYQPAAIVHHAYRRDRESLDRQMYDYGAGLGAYLTKLVLDRPSRLLEIAWRAPVGALHLLRSRPSPGRRAAAPQIAGLSSRERRGMVAGTAGYMLERRRRRALTDRPVELDPA